MKNIEEAKKYIITQAELHRNDEHDLFEIIETQTLENLLRFSINYGLRDEFHDIEQILNFTEDEDDGNDANIKKTSHFPANDSEKHEYLWNLVDEIIAEHPKKNIIAPKPIKDLFTTFQKSFWPSDDE